MLKFKSHPKLRISNSLAVFAALMLLVSALAGFSDSVMTARNLADQAAGIEPAVVQTLASETPDETDQKTNKSFKVSLFLFRIH